MSLSDHRSESTSLLDKGILTLLTNTGLKKFDLSAPGYSLDPSSVFRAEFLTELYLRECYFMTSNNNNNGKPKPLFKSLKRLSLRHVCISEETFVRIILSCPLIEYLRVSDCPGLTTIPETIFQADSLTELNLTECRLTDLTQPLRMKRLKTLSLYHVHNVKKETLEEIMRSCPLIERVVLFECEQLPTKIQLNNNRFEVRLNNWYGHDKYVFPRLKTLYLNKVRLSAELFQSFSSNFPSLEDLEIDHCCGFSEIQLTVCSIKRLLININSAERMVISIHAPNIRCLELFVHALPELTFHTETSREWKSRVVVLSNDKVLPLPWLLQLRELLNSLSESLISLDVFPNPFEDLKVENTNDVVFCNPVPLERVSIKRSDIHRSSLFPDLLDCLLLICRPRYIGGMNWYTNTNSEKNKLAEFIISEMMIRNQQGEMSRGYLWERDLEEISMQAWDQKSKGWNNVRVDGTSFPQFTTSNTKIRFRLKWRSGD